MGDVKEVRLSVRFVHECRRIIEMILFDVHAYQPMNLSTDPPADFHDKVIPWAYLKEWQRDNEYILKGYRR